MGLSDQLLSKTLLNMPSRTEVHKLMQKFRSGPVWAQIVVIRTKVGKCVCPWGRVLSKPEAQRRKENHRQARPPPTRASRSCPEVPQSCPELPRGATELPWSCESFDKLDTADYF